MEVYLGKANLNMNKMCAKKTEHWDQAQGYVRPGSSNAGDAYEEPRKAMWPRSYANGEQSQLRWDAGSKQALSGACSLEVSLQFVSELHLTNPNYNILQRAIFSQEPPWDPQSGELESPHSVSKFSDFSLGILNILSGLFLNFLPLSVPFGKSFGCCCYCESDEISINQDQRHHFWLHNYCIQPALQGFQEPGTMLETGGRGGRHSQLQNMKTTKSK